MRYFSRNNVSGILKKNQIFYTKFETTMKCLLQGYIFINIHIVHILNKFNIPVGFVCHSFFNYLMTKNNFIDFRF